MKVYIHASLAADAVGVDGVLVVNFIEGNIDIREIPVNNKLASHLNLTVRRSHKLTFNCCGVNDLTPTPEPSPAQAAFLHRCRFALFELGNPPARLTTVRALAAQAGWIGDRLAADCAVSGGHGCAFSGAASSDSAASSCFPYVGPWYGIP